MSAAAELRALKHPGDTATINGFRVKREALRFVLDASPDGCCASGRHLSDCERRYAYSVEDAARVIANG
jgi:hypothetical protein